MNYAEKIIYTPFLTKEECLAIIDQYQDSQKTSGGLLNMEKMTNFDDTSIRKVSIAFTPKNSSFIESFIDRAPFKKS